MQLKSNISKFEDCRFNGCASSKGYGITARLSCREGMNIRVSPTSRSTKYTLINPSGEISGNLAKVPNNIYGNKLMTVTSLKR
ncbi:hypothetical protein EAb13_CDS0068 [Acinetobacter phage EAb13]|nr:hypothetical protein EAb13_CDS0068 [Acinetobacter phage EAb13]